MNSKIEPEITAIDLPEVKADSWRICPECKGVGKIKRRLRKKVKLRYKLALEDFERSNGNGLPPTRPKAHQEQCKNCKGSGLLPSSYHPVPDSENYPHVSIIGGGIGGVALAVACFHRGIPFTIYERDSSFDVRSQGYGLTLQQASKAIEGLGIFSLKDGVISTRHVVHTTDGKVIGEWGIRKWLSLDEQTYSKRTNIHIARQSLRLALLEQLGGYNNVKWGHQLVEINTSDSKEVNLSFMVNGNLKKVTSELVVGADGIRSSVRGLLVGDKKAPLRYLDCIVILGICPLKDLKNLNSELLDSATVFQTANGNERIYMMPFTSESVMWQLSFPMLEHEAKKLSESGAIALKEEAIIRSQWHDPIPQIVAATDISQISGYPVYDREMMNAETLNKLGNLTLIGDAAHPMSPFKGQGANQAILDALSLARGISKNCRPSSNWKEAGLRRSVLTKFELDMLERSASKVKDSAEAARFLHSEIVLHKADEPRGRSLKKKEG